MTGLPRCVKDIIPRVSSVLLVFPYGKKIKCICLTSLTRAKPKEKMAFPT